MEDEIRRDLKSAYAAKTHGNNGEIGFFVLASNGEILKHVDKVFRRCGAFGVLEGDGKVHYLIDARKGVEYAVNSLDGKLTYLVKEAGSEFRTDQEKTCKAVKKVLQRYPFNQNLQGYRMLEQSLSFCAADESLLFPISKRLMCKVAKFFATTPQHAERNIRYLLSDMYKRATDDIMPAKSRSAQKAVMYLQKEVVKIKNLES